MSGGGGGSTQPQETAEQKRLDRERIRKDAELQALMLRQIRNMKGAGGVSGSSGDLG